MRDTYKLDYLGGNCPVQAEGTVNGWRFYFRARWDDWSVSVYSCEDRFLDPEWFYEQPYTTLGGGAAGWMEENEARVFLDQALKAFLSSELGQRPPDTPVDTQVTG